MEELKQNFIFFSSLCVALHIQLEWMQREATTTAATAATAATLDFILVQRKCEEPYTWQGKETMERMMTKSLPAKTKTSDKITKCSVLCTLKFVSWVQTLGMLLYSATAVAGNTLCAKVWNVGALLPLRKNKQANVFISLVKSCVAKLKVKMIKWLPV